MLDSDVLESPCVISPIYITGSVSFLLFLYLWYGGARVIYHDVRIIIFDNVTNIMVEENSIGHLECWPLWDINNKLITILTVLGH